MANASAFSNRIKVRELDESTEWTLFDNPNVLSIARNWIGVLEYCLERGFHPIAIFYEKLEEDDGEAIYVRRAGFDLNRDLL